MALRAADCLTSTLAAVVISRVVYDNRGRKQGLNGGGGFVTMGVQHQEWPVSAGPATWPGANWPGANWPRCPDAAYTKIGRTNCVRGVRPGEAGIQSVYLIGLATFLDGYETGFNSTRFRKVADGGGIDCAVERKTDDEILRDTFANPASN